jgi:ketosteroid isomerase-like protein
VVTLPSKDRAQIRRQGSASAILDAMPEEPIEVICRIYARPLELDPDLLEGLAEVATQNAEFDFTDAYPDGKVVRGVDGVRRIAANWPWGGLRFEPERFIEVDADRVLVFVRATATGIGSGIPVERRTAHECTFYEGSLVRFKVYSDRNDALAAAALSDQATPQTLEHRSRLPR